MNLFIYWENLKIFKNSSCLFHIFDFILGKYSVKFPLTPTDRLKSVCDLIKLALLLISTVHFQDVKSNGPKIEPCGTLENVLNVFEENPL